MSQSPLPIPPLEYAPPPPGKDLRKVAIYQRNINLCILAYILVIVASFAGPPQIRALFGLLVLAIGTTGAVFVFMLALQLYNAAAGIVLGILSIIPIIGVLFLLIVNGRATAMLRRHNIRVGLLGAKLSQIPDAGTTI